MISDINLKQNKIKIDLKDKKILYELDLNARQSNSEIAKKVGLSKDSVNYRIKRLKKSGLIQGFYTIVDSSKLGYLSFRVYLRLFEITNEIEKNLIDYLINNKKVGWVARREGFYNIAFLVWVKDIFEFNDFWNEFIKKFRQNFNEFHISIWTKIYHYSKSYLLDSKKELIKKELIVGNKEKSDLDITDLEILRLITPSARLSLVLIAKKLKLSERAIAYRIKLLEKKKIILGYRVLIDVPKLGYDYYKVDINLKDSSIIKDLMNIARINPNFIYVNELINGTSDFEFDLQIKNKEELFDLLKDLKEKFKKSIRNYEYSTTIKEYKLLYLPI